jgi:CHAT domain-containing protein
MSRGAVVASLAIGIALSVTACQEKTEIKPVTLEQAKRVAVELHGETFVPPPRTVDDIVPLLEQIKPPTEEISARRSVAASVPSSGLQGKDLAAFYYQRCVARKDLGQLAEALADCRQAAALGRVSSSSDEQKHYFETLAEADAAAGHFRDEFEHRLERERVTPLAQQNGRFWSELLPAYALMNLGNLPVAEQLLAHAEGEFEASRYWRDARLYFPDRQRVFEDIKGLLDLNRGRYAAAETSFRVALAAASETADNLQAASWQPQSHLNQTRENVRLHLARSLELQGKLAEAEATAREALVNELRNFDSAADGPIRAVARLAAILGEEDRQTEAELLAKLTVEMKLKSGLVPADWTVVEARCNVATYLVRQSHWKQALAIYDSIAADLAHDPEGRDRFLNANISYAFALLDSGHGEKAIPILDKAVAKEDATLGQDNRFSAGRHGWRAVAYERMGRHEAALADFQQAIPVLTSVRLESGASEHMRMLQIVLRSYLHLLTEIKGTPLELRVGDIVGEAFRIADLVRGQSVQQAVANAAARLQINDPDLADLARREQDAGQGAAALQGLLVNLVASSESQRDAGAIARLRGNIQDLRQAQTTLRQEIERRFPAYAALIDPKPPSIDQVRTALHDGEAFVGTVSLADRTLLWAVSKEGPTAFAVVKAKTTDISGQVSDLRRALNPKAATLEQIPPFDVEAAHALYGTLLEPVRDGWKDAKSLIIASNWFGQLPPGLLVTKAVPQPVDQPGALMFSAYKTVPFLMRDEAVSQVPSAAALVALRALPKGAPSRRAFVGFGDPVFNRTQAEEQRQSEAQLASASVEPRGVGLRATPETRGLNHADLSMVPRLPDTAVELRAAATALGADPAKDVFLGPAASEPQVRSMKLDDRRVVMFATHGLVAGDLDGLTQPALALSAPAIAGGGGDGLLTMEKILGLKLDADWVVLSACNTGAGEGRGAEAVSGLGRAFFYAGARAVLVTNWPVETVSARLLTSGTFYHHVGDGAITRAEALRRSEKDLIDGPGFVDTDGHPVFSYAHPLFWAPFTLVGDEG